MRSRSRSTDIHSTALIAQGASLGDGVQIGPFCTVGPFVEIEDGVHLVSHVTLDGHTRIGQEVVLYPFCSVGLAPQDQKYKNEPTRCEIGARTQIRENCTIHRGTATGRGITQVGTDCLIMAVAHVAHDCQIGDHVIIASNALMGGHVTIADDVVIGGGVAIHQFVRIGRASIIGGVSGIEADVIPFGSVLGNRAQLVGLNAVGLRRRGFAKTQIQGLHAAFRVLFRNEGVFAQRLTAVRDLYGSDPLVAEVLAFIDTPSHRGLIRSGRFRGIPTVDPESARPNEEVPEPAEHTKAQYTEMLRRIAELEEALASIPPLSPPETGVGHNNPPEPLDPLPLSSLDQVELERAVETLKTQPEQPQSEPTAAIEAANAVASIGERLRAYAVRQGDTFVSEAAKAAGAEFGKWAVRAPIWALLAERLIALSHAVIEWITSAGFTF